MTYAWGLPSPPGGLAERVGWTLLHSLWQLAAVALALTIVLALLRRRSPQARYAAGCAAMVAMFALPVVTFVSLAPLTKSEHDSATPHGSAVAARDGSQPVGGSGGDPSAGLFQARWARRIAGAWVLGVAGFSLWNFGGWVALRRMRHLCNSPMPADVLARFRALAQRMGVRLPVGLLRSTMVAGPVALGWLRPLVLVPASALSGLTPAQLDAILAHELAHIRRHDYLVNLLQTFAETLLFYHPAVWWASRRVRIERELCCDDVASEFTDGGRVDYADALVAMEALRGPAPGFEVGPPVLAVGACDGGLVSRIRRLLGAPQRTPGAWRAAVLAMLAGVILPLILASTTGAFGPRASRVEVGSTAGNGEGDDLERQSPLRALRVPRLADVSRWATKMIPGIGQHHLGTGQDPDDSTLSPFEQAIVEHVASAVRRGARVIDATGIPEGVQRVATVG